MSTQRVYADYAASAPLRPSAARAVSDALASGVGNASSPHAEGARARALVESAREEVAAVVGAHPLEIVFTSGATEANNLALHGMVAVAKEGCLRLAVAATEHASVLAPARLLAARGHEVTPVAVDAEGRIAASAVAGHFALLAIAAVNAETGVVQDIRALGEVARRNGSLFHVDAAQAAHVLALHVDELGVDLMTLSSHKVGGPPGTGALYVRRGTHLGPVLHGGAQEHGLRPGTENVPGCVGFATALAAAGAERRAESTRLAALARQLREGITAAWPAVQLVEGAVTPHIVHATFPGLDGDSLVAGLDLAGVAVSAGSACAAGAAEPSHVLLAMGRTPADARSAVRISLGWASRPSDVARILEVLPRVLARARLGQERSWDASALS